MTATEHMRPDGIFEVLMGFMASKHLFVANEIGLFTALADGSATLEQLAERVGVPQRTLRNIATRSWLLGSSSERTAPIETALPRTLSCPGAGRRTSVRLFAS